ncbi:RNA-binding S4 domain-containing protein [Georgenia alba]|uniref:RNA-binding S4 domain-containing protein n=1 Tax=Georgenia alba TaxID=2233858 RepID=A0ABW2QAA2_9MICO
MSGVASTRVDRWLWAVRVFKTRSAAAAACRAGHVRVRGERAKPATSVAVGDEVVVRGVDRSRPERILEVRRLLEKRVGASLAAEAVVDRSPAPLPRELFAVPVRERGSGRPTKRERREIQRLRGY